MRVALLVALLVAQGATAMTLDVSFEDGFQGLRADAVIPLAPNEAGMLRNAADGDRDGNVTAEEANRFYAQLRAQMSSNARGPTNLTLDGRPPTLVAVRELSIDNLTQPGAQAQLRVSMALAFQPDAGPRHTLRLGESPGGAEAVTQVTVRAPPGHLIESASSLPAARLSADATTLSFTGTASSAAAGVIVFAPQANGTPGAAAPILFVLLLAAALRRA